MFLPGASFGMDTDRSENCACLAISFARATTPF